MSDKAYFEAEKAHNESMENTAKEETVGTGQNYVNFGSVIEHLRNGGLAQRKGWNGSRMFVCKQVPSQVPESIIPKMSSLPNMAKTVLSGRGLPLAYGNQMIIIKPDSSIDSWVASSSDTFAEDWILM